MEWYSIVVDRDVKGSPGRRERKAQQTRQRVLAAAEALFVGDGYGATTITAIAEAADVAVQTVYAVFGTKRAILAELLEARIAGDGQPRRLSDRQDWQAMEREPDPRRQIERLASIATRIGEQVAALSEVFAAAAATDPEIADLHASQQRARYEDQRRLARSLAQKGALRPGLSEDRAADVVWALVNARTYRSLVGDRRWTAEEYERWLGSLLACALLG
jgi:TetR/AcrR family transcriptional regulator of autoinduction and epiphytic fitness